MDDAYASSLFRVDEEGAPNYSDIEHDLHPDDGSDEDVHSEATQARASAPAEATSPDSPGGDDGADGDGDGDDGGGVASLPVAGAAESVENAASELRAVSWTCRFCTATSENTNALQCSICGSKRVERDEPSFPPMWLKTEDIEIRPMRENNGDGTDDGWVLFDESKHRCYGWDLDTPRGNLCYVRCVGQEGEESIEMEWREAHRRGRSRMAPSGDSPQKKTVAQLQAEEHFKKKRKRCMSTNKPPARRKPPMKKRGSKSHYLEERLDKKMEEIDAFMPEEIAGNVNECMWFPFKEGKCGPRIHHPVLTLHPSAISGNSEALQKMEVMIREVIETNDIGKWNKHLIFFYSAKISMRKDGPALGHKAFALVDPSLLVPYVEGIQNKYDKPEHLIGKIDSGEMFSGDDEAFWLGLEQIKKDSELDKERRGGPFFFENQRQAYFDQAERLKKERVREWEGKRVDRARKRAERRQEDQQHGLACSNAAGTELISLELYSGEARITAALQENGFGDNCITLDNDPKKKSDSDLSIEQLEAMIEENGHRYRHHPIRTCYDVIWAAPCCTTYSIAQSKMIYRTYDCICGIPKSATERKAREADDNVDSLVDILLEFRSLNHHHNHKPPILCIENPDGYLPKHPLSARFEDELGLTALKISYCKFGNEKNPLPRKDTVLWTDSPSLIDKFKNGEFSCKNDCRCMAKGRHFVGVQDYADRCAAYPDEMVKFVSKLIVKDARALIQNK